MGRDGALGKALSECEEVGWLVGKKIDTRWEVGSVLEKDLLQTI